MSDSGEQKEARRTETNGHSDHHTSPRRAHQVEREAAPIPSFPRCPDCGAEAHELTCRPGVRQVDGQTDEGPTVYDERELIDFAWLPQ